MPNKFIPPQTTTTTRTAATPIDGEILYDTDEKKLYYGDGTTVGGKAIGSPTVTDNVFRIQDNSDNTKQLAFEVSTVTTGTTRTLTVPDSNGTVLSTDTLTDKALYYYDASSKLFKPVGIGTAGQTLIAQPSINPPYQWAAPTGREALTANRTYYVRTDGNDSNNGLADTTGGAFLTWTKAIDTIAKLDGNGYSATIKGTGTFSENIVIDKSFVGLSRITLEGDTTTPSNCSISVSSGFSIRVNTMTNIDIKGLLLSGGTGGIIVAKGDLTIAGNCVFGASNFQFYLQGQKAQVTQASNYTITGGGTYHITCVGESYFEAYGPYTVTISGSPTFTTFAFFDRGGSGSFENITYSGSITGTKYDVKALSFVYSSGTTFPGSGQTVHALGYYGS